MKVIYTWIVIATIFYGAAGHASEPVYFVGFNSFIETNKDHAEEVFDTYISQLMPVMKQHQISLSVFNVDFGGSDELKADAITFGRAPDMMTLQSFFEDPALHAIFPMLMSIINEHQVIFTQEDVMSTPIEEKHILLALSWVESQANLTSLHTLMGELKPLQKTYGVERKSASSAIMSNKGLGNGVVPTTPPNLVEVWTMKNPHAYLESKKFGEINNQSKVLLSRINDFWISPRYTN